MVNRLSTSPATAVDFRADAKRRFLAESNAGLELLVDRMNTLRSNDEFLAEVAKAPSM